MRDFVIEIRKSMGISQEELAGLLGTSFATVNRWENGRAIPNKMAQMKLYELCRQNEIDLEAMISKKIKKAAEDASLKTDRIILYHGSKSGIKGDIAPISRDRCDFGRGFYMGTDPYQPLTLICDFDKSRFYVLSLDLTGLNVLHIKPDIEWAMLVAFNRSKMESAAGTQLYDHYSKIARGYDVIVGSIANDRMFYVLDNFFLGNITDKALVKSLSALKLGEQYVAVTDNACRRVRIETEVELSYLERQYLQDLSEANRVRGVRLANDICRDYRREGLFFDEILQGKS